MQFPTISNQATLRKISLILLALVSLACTGTVFWIMTMAPPQTQTSASIASTSSDRNSGRKSNRKSNQNRRDRSKNGVIITPTPVHELAIKITLPPLLTDSATESLMSSSSIDRSATDNPEAKTSNVPAKSMSPTLVNQ